MAAPAVTEVTPAPPPTPGPPPLAATAAPQPMAETEDQIFARKSVDELNAERPLDDAFFELDSAVLRERDRMALQKSAEWMRRWASTRVRVEGHGDSRGTQEYNLALGDRRAAAVKAYLEGLGVSSERLIALSKGEEQPFCFEEHEGCWQLNRRGHMIIFAK